MGQIITNKYNLPEPLVKAVSKDTYKKRGDISVTTLIDSPKINYLRSVHDYEVDVSEMIWAYRGSAVHHILEVSAEELNKEYPGRFLSEFQMEYTHKVSDKMSMNITGTGDLIDKGIGEKKAILYDYKNCSYYKISGTDVIVSGTEVVRVPKKGECLDWIRQLNIYAYILRKKYNIVVEELRIIALLNDWDRNMITQLNYPPASIVEVSLPIYNDDIMEKFISKRTSLHLKAFFNGKKFGDDAVEPCTREERWAKKDTWKIYTSPNNTSRSKKNFEINSEEDNIAAEFFFQSFKASNKDAIKVLVKGSDTRCISFCPVNIHCNYFKSLIKNNNGK